MQNDQPASSSRLIVLHPKFFFSSELKWQTCSITTATKFRCMSGKEINLKLRSTNLYQIYANPLPKNWCSDPLRHGERGEGRPSLNPSARGCRQSLSHLSFCFYLVRIGSAVEHDSAPVYTVTQKKVDAQVLFLSARTCVLSAMCSRWTNTKYPQTFEKFV